MALIIEDGVVTPITGLFWKDRQGVTRQVYQYSDFIEMLKPYELINLGLPSNRHRTKFTASNSIGAATIIGVYLTGGQVFVSYQRDDSNLSPILEQDSSIVLETFDYEYTDTNGTVTSSGTIDYSLNQTLPNNFTQTNTLVLKNVVVTGRSIPDIVFTQEDLEASPKIVFFESVGQLSNPATRSNNLARDIVLDNQGNIINLNSSDVLVDCLIQIQFTIT